MSSPQRSPLSGVIRQDKKIVGAICLPDDDLRDFIEQFNHCYGPLRLHIESTDYLPPSPTRMIPVGSTYRQISASSPGDKPDGKCG